MEHGARLSTSRVMAIAFIFMSVLIVLSLSVNVIQGVNNYRLQNEQRTAVTPMAFNAPFAVSQNSADASYLQQMALSFIALRLNVSSETVDASHQALLQYIRPGAQNQMKVILAEEAKRIKNDNVNSAFFQTSVRVWPQYGRVEIRGVLKTWIGDSKPFTDIKHYILILKRENGVTWLDNFGETDDEKNNTAIIFGSLFFSCSVMAANGTLAPTVVPMVNGGQASIAISNTSPNLFTVPGDRIIAVNSLDGALTNNEQTASGGVVVATVNKKPFTFILETERGLNLSIQAVPREGAGRTIQLVSDLRGTGEEAGAWETSTPYESLLVTISQAVRGGKLPAGWYQVPVTKETLQAPAGLSSVADAVWTGNHLKMVRFAVENKTLSALNIRESDFWQPGTRAVMFSQPASQLLAGARMDVYVIRDGEGN
ncbi:TPA: type-F conjugative transfer system secretin TraK [Escherichia coli]|nr:type-F conjugative transfer system secretin TraK [Escherichia coli]STJ46442.1 conjugative transfer protein [Escherichia coli]HAI1330577.1 type-F conjugative transfer system secretin TraK [Escherichia coli]HAJ7076309.1 type-F conjugative transfer system secretin TraK [Escherichia coli]